uniref:Smg4_UPF3 domain-containing protein n=1 Tax=Panagrellus redivivus TaxID=6233 RepID=A0A7E4V6V9_PANRE
MSVTATQATANSVAGKKVKKEKKKFYKLNIRNLPRGITSEELQAKLSIDPAPTRFWLRPGEPFLEYDARPYAFVVFGDFEVAARFQHQWHGRTITAEATGEESVMLVEKAPNQDWAKHGLSMPKNAKPITSHVDYIKFVEEAESRCITKQVDFDVLVNEIIERETKLAAGICQDTPLTDYFVKRAHDKLMKGRTKVSSFKAEKLSTPPRFEKSSEYKQDKPAPVRERPEKPGPKPRPPKPVKEKREPRERKPPTPKSFSSSDSALPSTTATTGEAASEKPGKPPRKRPARPPRGPKVEGEKPNPQKEAIGDSSSSKPSFASSAPKPSDKESGSSSKPGPSAAKKAGPANSGAGAGRNKDRPERAIYQPGRGRRYKPGGDSRPSTTPAP